MAESRIIDIASPTANMYGCEPCPKCGSEFRAPYRREQGLIIECDCGFNEQGKNIEDEETNDR